MSGIFCPLAKYRLQEITFEGAGMGCLKTIIPEALKC
jgi:hypothetical protein